MLVLLILFSNNTVSSSLEHLYFNCFICVTFTLRILANWLIFFLLNNFIFSTYYAPGEHILDCIGNQYKEVKAPQILSPGAYTFSGLFHV